MYKRSEDVRAALGGPAACGRMDYSRPSSIVRSIEQRIRYQLPDGKLMLPFLPFMPSSLQSVFQASGADGSACSVSPTMPFGHAMSAPSSTVKVPVIHVVSAFHC